ncbi:MAG: DUF5818 domain-containing protein [Thermodesulforhabdaceae bacterium]
MKKGLMVVLSVVMAVVVGLVFSVPAVQAAEEAKKEAAPAAEKKEAAPAPAAEKKEAAPAPAAEKKEAAPAPAAEKKEAAPAAEKKEAAPAEAKLASMKGKVEAGGEAILLKTEDGKEFKLEGEGLKDYVGKQVQVTGTLDEATKTLKVKEIKPAQ